MSLPDFVESYQQEVVAIGQLVNETKDKLKNLTSSAASEDGAVTVTVTAAGALHGIAFGRKADEIPVAQLAPMIMSTAKAAHAAVAARMTAALVPLLGSDSAALHQIQEHLPTARGGTEPESPGGSPARVDEDADFGLDRAW